MKTTTKAERKTLHDFAIKESPAQGVWGQAYLTAIHKTELCERLAKKAMSGATLSQRDRWQIAEILTGESHPEPKGRGKQSDPDDDYRVFMRFCTIAAELSNKGTPTGKLKTEALKILSYEESTKKHTPSDSTIRKAIERGAYESNRIKTGIK